MTKDMSISDTGKNLMKIPEMLADAQSTIAVTRAGKPVLAVVSWHFTNLLLKPSTSGVAHKCNELSSNRSSFIAKSSKVRTKLQQLYLLFLGKLHRYLPSSSLDS